MKFFKNKKGFTLVELVVVIAILGILAGIAIPRFMDATASARGAKIVADLRTIDSAIMMYYARNGNSDTSKPTFDDLKGNYLAGEPKPPASGQKAIIAKDSGLTAEWTITATAYDIIDATKNTAGATETSNSVSFGTRRATLGEKTVEQLTASDAAGGTL